MSRQRLHSVLLISTAFTTLLFSDSTQRANGMVAAQGPRVQFSESWFDRTCFGQLTAAMARRRCVELLDKRIELAGETVDLDDDQRQKLLAAGKVDIHRFFTKYDELKREFDFGVISTKEWQERVKIVHLRSQPLTEQIQNGLNGETSLYSKTLRSCVDQDSADKIQQAYLQYSEKRYSSKIDQTLKQVLRNAVDRESRVDPDKSVRQVVTEVLVESTDPPEFYGNSRNYINTIVTKLVSVEGRLELLLNEREMSMIRALHRMQQPGSRQPTRVMPQRREPNQPAGARDDENL